MGARQPKELVRAVQHIAPASRTATVTPTTGVDCLGYEWVRFQIDAGTVGASTAITFKIQESSNSGGSPDTFADVSGATSSQITTANDNAIHYIDVLLNSRERYLRCVGTFDTGSNASLFSVSVLRFHPDRDSITADSNGTTVTAV